MKLRSFLFIVLLSTLAVLVFVPAALAQSGTPIVGQPTDNDVNRVASQLYCPVCENTPLDVCPTQACAQWRDLIRQKLAQGWSDGQIKDYFVQQYGDRVLASPPMRETPDFNWLLPIAIGGSVLLALYVLVRVLQGMRASAPAKSAPPAAPNVDPEYLNRLEKELKKRE